MNTKVFALILAGGAGTRFWPASRSIRPKQLLTLTGNQPLLLQAAERVLPLCDGGWAGVRIASGAHLEGPTRAILQDLPTENLLLEPVPRNTAPCIAWAAWTIARTDPEAVVMVLPSDQHVSNADAFRKTLGVAIECARAGSVTTVGIRPTRAETGYGYIELESRATTSDVALPIKRFVEKPDKARAEEFVRSGRHLWNAGMFFFRAMDMIAAVRKHLPELASGLDAIDEAARKGDERNALREQFAKLPSISIDHGVIEKMENLSVVPAEFGWSDVGSWEAAFELAPKDADDNCAPEHAVLIDSRGNHVVDLRTKGDADRVIALVGLRDLVIVETDDALLVLPRERAQDVKLVVDELKARGLKDRT